MVRRSGILVLLTAIAASFLMAGTASANPVVVVGTPGPGCNPDAPTIQAGVNQVVPTGIVAICPGTYVEQVTVKTNDIVIKPLVVGTVTVTAPASMSNPKAIFHVKGATGVTIRRLTIRGPGGGACGSLQAGVKVDLDGYARIAHDVFLDMRDEPLSGCPNGVAVQLGTGSTPGAAEVDHNTISGYQQAGMLVQGVGSDGEIHNNRITGDGPTSTIVQNGIVIRDGATATILNNKVFANASTLPATPAAGMLLSDPGAVRVHHNVVKTSDVAILAAGVASGSEFDRNRVSAGALDGIDVTGGSLVSVHNNRATGFGRFGIWTDDAGNVFAENRMKGNGVYDARDESTGAGTAGTGNTWTGNTCTTSLPAGLCA